MQKGDTDGWSFFASDMGAIALYHFVTDLGIIPLLARKCAETLMKLIQGERDIECHQITDVHLQIGGTA